MCAKMYFPLRWESTGDQWWFASPIDWASANGHYDLVKHLLLIDSNLIFKLTSLLRIRRLEAVWDDDGAAFRKCRARVARNLLHECETARGYNSLIRAGYGGWLLYTAASAGDVVFVRELLDRDPLLVFGEGEYGVTDLFYAAARSKSAEVFRLLYDHSVADKGGRRSSLFHWEMMNRAVHAAARGGAVAVLDELLGDGSDVLGFRDAQGSTVLHTAAGRGQVPEHKCNGEDEDGVPCPPSSVSVSAADVLSYMRYLVDGPPLICQTLPRVPKGILCVTISLQNSCLPMVDYNTNGLMS